MNEQDGSPGNGAPPSAPATPAPTAPAATTGGAAAPAPTLDDIKVVVGSMLGDFRNGLFADLRKTGALKSDKPTPAPAETAPSSNAQPNANQDVSALFARQRAFDRAVGAAGLNDEQAAMLEGMFQAMRPEDPGQWASTVIKTMGLGQKNATSSTATQTAQPQTAPAAQPSAPQPAPQPTTNISDRGPASSSDARDPIAVMKHRITDVTRDDYDRIVADLGPQKASEQYVANARAYLRSVKLVPDRRSR